MVLITPSSVLELEFGVLVFVKEENWRTPEKNPRSKTITNNKLNPHMTLGRIKRTFKRTMNTNTVGYKENSLRHSIRHDRDIKNADAFW